MAEGAAIQQRRDGVILHWPSRHQRGWRDRLHEQQQEDEQGPFPPAPVLVLRAALADGHGWTCPAPFGAAMGWAQIARASASSSAGSDQRGVPSPGR